MSFLLRSFFTTALVGSITIATYAQSETPVPPSVITEAVTVSPAALDPLMPPTELKGGSYKDGKYREYLLKHYPNDKEARAVIHLFSRKQRGGFVWLTAGAATIGLIATQTGTTTHDSGVAYTFEVTPLGYGLLVGLFGGVGIGKLSRFSNNKLYQTLSAYDQTKTLPVYVQKRLTKKDRK
ncbi:hypothetical protein ACW9KT_07940 [Hymenobacter sp. HD11105]